MLLDRDILLAMGFKEQSRRLFIYTEPQYKHTFHVSLETEEPGPQAHWTIYSGNITYMSSETITTVEDVMRNIVEFSVKIGKEIIKDKLTDVMKL